MPLAPGDVLQNRYRIEGPLGQGGMGTVYLAAHLHLRGKLCAVKENADASPRAQHQFEEEAAILASLSHPNLPRVFDHFIEPDGRQYLVMDYVEGQDLESLRHGAPQPEAQVLAWMSPIFAAVQYLHSRGVVHRDIKPGNIRLCPDGQAALVDFSIAKVHTPGRMTSTGARATSSGYAPPEQYTGGTDERTDVYALGATLYCLLCGQPPPESPALAAGVASLASPRTLNPAVSPATEGAILRAMTLDANGRFQSVTELRWALDGQVQEPRPGQTAAATVPGQSPTIPAMAAAAYPPEGGAPTVPAWQAGAAPALPISAAVAGAGVRRWPLAPGATRRLAAALVGAAALTLLGLWGWQSRQASPAAAPAPTATAIPATATPAQPTASPARPTSTLTATRLPATATPSPSLKPAATPTWRPATTKALYVSAGGDGVYVRSSPDLQARVKAWADGTAVEALGKEGDWYYVRAPDGYLGFIPAQYLATTPPAVAGMVYVPAGEFLMGATDGDIDAESDEKPQHRVYLDAFYFDKTEVTNAAYARCVQSGSCTAPSSAASYSRLAYYGDALYGNYPVVYALWGQAQTYCAWAGGRLPTDAEWEKAARGTDGRKYPWGNDPPTGTRVNFCDRSCAQTWKDSAVDDGYADTAPVGSYPAGASPYGVLDMAGNAWEWVADWYSATYYASSPARNPTGPTVGSYRVVRSGSAHNPPAEIRAANRYFASPTGSGGYAQGFRCARSP